MSEPTSLDQALREVYSRHWPPVAERFREADPYGPWRARVPVYQLWYPATGRTVTWWRSGEYEEKG
jgi:hypothetical protein